MSVIIRQVDRMTQPMAPSFSVGDRVRFRVGDGPIMTVSAFDVEHGYADLEYMMDRTVRRLGIVARALVLADDAGRTEADDAAQ